MVKPQKMIEMELELYHFNFKYLDYDMPTYDFLHVFHQFWKILIY